ncbi:hypothetical protein D1970_13390 [Mesobacillus zeae]|uniref:Uncharacterized protein n=1 Tax=Mesobacillus zeae TaxID=1917180 RepID=A0A398B3W3_9BACI|nr:hypothetical protein D1970_13390 [Mesobacillus zeae]
MDKKLFNISYLVFLLLLVLNYFAVPSQSRFPVLLAILLWFGTYQTFLMIFHKKSKSLDSN